MIQGQELRRASKAVQEAEERAVFDAKKVDSIKEAIQNGSYPLNF